jgi:hypothetical protein
MNIEIDADALVLMKKIYAYQTYNKWAGWHLSINTKSIAPEMKLLFNLDFARLYKAKSSNDTFVILTWKGLWFLFLKNKEDELNVKKYKHFYESFIA